MPDHVHVLLKLSANHRPSDIVGQIKRRTSRLFNEHHSSNIKWQKGYGAFSISRSHVEQVRTYINNQDVHHQSKTFKEEYINWLESYGEDYDMQYVFRDD